MNGNTLTTKLKQDTTSAFAPANPVATAVSVAPAVVSAGKDVQDELGIVAGHKGYQFAQGQWYRDGVAVDCDANVALRDVRTAANGGDPVAMISLGRWYSFVSASVRTGLNRAIDWFLRAAQKGIALGYLLAGQLFAASGNNEWAARSFREASAQGISSADTCLEELLVAHPMLRLKLD